MLEMHTRLFETRSQIEQDSPEATRQNVAAMQRITAIDSHTGGEPTRIVTSACRRLTAVSVSKLPYAPAKITTFWSYTVSLKK